MNYKVDGEIKTLDLSKVEIVDDFDEEAQEEVMDNFKMLFSSGLYKGKEFIGEKSPVLHYLRGFGLSGLDFSSQPGKTFTLNFGKHDEV